MASHSPKYAFEDFTVGRVFTLGTYATSAEDIVDFARKYDPQPFHVDDAAGRESIYGSLIGSGWQTTAIAMRLVCDAIILDSTSMGSPGVDEIRWLRPVRPGDVLSGEFEVLDVRRSKSKPDRGVVVSAWRIRNQHGDVVMTTRGMGLFGCRDPLPSN